MRRSVLFIVIAFFFNLAGSIPQKLNVPLERLTTEDGLSHSFAICIHQDRNGFMWFGTIDGLNKFDGYGFKVYKKDPTATNSISNNSVYAIFEDTEGVLWLGTKNGLNLFDVEKEAFFLLPFSEGLWVMSICEDNSGLFWIGTFGGGLIQFSFDPLTKEVTILNTYHRHWDRPLKEDLAANSIYRVYQDKAGLLWIGTVNGFNIFNPATEEFIRHGYAYDNGDSIRLESVMSFYEDVDGGMWIGTTHGLHKYRKDQDTFRSYQHDPSDSGSIMGNRVYSIQEDRNGEIWITSDNGGLMRYDRENDHFIQFQYALDNKHCIDFFEDDASTYWVVTALGGIFRYDGRRLKFRHYSPSLYNSQKVGENLVTSMCEDKAGRIWVGIQNGGISVLQPTSNNAGLREVAHYLNDPEDKSSVSHNSVRQVYEDRAGTIWVTTSGGGLNKVIEGQNAVTNKFMAYRWQKDDTTSISNDWVESIFQDSYGLYWIAIGNGLNLFNPETETFKCFCHNADDSGSISDNAVTCMNEDESGTLWIGTERGGLNRYNRHQMSFFAYRNEPANQQSLSDNHVTIIFTDHNGTLWIGTHCGLNRFNVKDSTFTRFLDSDGLGDNFICGILEDEHGYLWISTHNGLSKFDPVTEAFFNFDMSDGLQSKDFALLSCMRGRDGEMYFGGINGFNVFHPDSIQRNRFVPPVLITDFKLFNQSVTVAENSPLQKSMPYTKNITLSYQQNFITFEYVALNYTNAHKNQYQYMLHGIDSDWIEAGTRRDAHYTNLSPGHYVFSVKGSNNDMIWNPEPTSVSIHILPPPWATWWAYTFYVFVILFLVYRYRLFLIGRFQLQSELKYDRLKIEKIEEMEQLKSKFFANISHEFRTPLTLIIGPLEKFIAQSAANEEAHREFSLMHRSAQRLLSLINQLLDLSK